MASIIEELQREGYSSTSNVTDILRKAYVVARKLKVKEFEQWLRNEMNGYKCPISEIPDYRSISGEVKAWNPYQGWIPIMIPDEEIMNLISNNKMSQSISEIEDLVKTDSQSNFLLMTIPTGLQNQLAKMFEFETQYQLHFSKSQAEKILDSVRNIVLEWALRLEEDGILGEGLSFSKEEVKVAKEQAYTIFNLNGDFRESQIQQNTNNSSQTMTKVNMDLNKVSELIDSLKENINSLQLDDESKKIVEAEANTVSAQLESPQPQQGIISKSLTSIRTILEDTGTGLATSGILYLISQIMN